MINLAKNNDELYRFKLAKKLLSIASNIAMNNFEVKKKVSTKEDFSLVTEVDKMIERELVRLISDDFPYDGIVGEEATNKISKNGYQWTIDPIDGTIAYAHNLPLFSTLIGLTYKGRTILGIASFPALSKIFFAVDGQGAYCIKDNLESKIYTKKIFSRKQFLQRQLIFYHSGEEYFKKESDKSIFHRVKSFSKYVRSIGDAYGHMMVAQGNSDIMIDTVLKIWDIIPLKIILDESGNVFFTKPYLNLENRLQNYFAISCTSRKLLNTIMSESKKETSNHN